MCVEISSLGGAMLKLVQRIVVAELRCDRQPNGSIGTKHWTNVGGGERARSVAEDGGEAERCIDHGWSWRGG